ncbi:MAG TPA: 30S ribosome-binding factor RbfA [Candidatus Omnitrophota bacterium]|nr:30S ribosome-binding factor RbfA [Candidatus Omnitrophota bacterium]HPD85091.1 30S ribosome-binding factor RbfA [Candidatus Omnitrophota bacterium]HRZ03949.1 30S ribosome-binding factor RbfA [Candidatus Omnitrophota bacterium]
MARIEKVNEAVKEGVSEIIHLEVKDPRLEFVTITEAKVSRDLQHATVYFSVLGDEKKRLAAEEGLESARGFIRKMLAQRVQMRYTPEIKFIFDETIERSMRIEEQLRKINDEL